jgi:hypothetical protein
MDGILLFSSTFVRTIYEKWQTYFSGQAIKNPGDIQTFGDTKIVKIQ